MAGLSAIHSLASLTSSLGVPCWLLVVHIPFGLHSVTALSIPGRQHLNVIRGDSPADALAQPFHKKSTVSGRRPGPWLATQQAPRIRNGKRGRLATMGAPGRVGLYSCMPLPARGAQRGETSAFHVSRGACCPPSHDTRPTISPSMPTRRCAESPDREPGALALPLHAFATGQLQAIRDVNHLC